MMQNPQNMPVHTGMPHAQGTPHAVPASRGLASVLATIERVTIRGLAFFAIMYGIESFAPQQFRPSTVMGGAIGNITGSDAAAREELEAAYKKAMADVDLYLSEKEKGLQVWLDAEIKRNEVELTEAQMRLELQQQDIQVRRDVMRSAMGGQALMSVFADIGCGIGQMAGDMQVTSSTCGLGASIRKNVQNELNDVSPSGPSPYR
ncbi:hypothetical protein LCM08_26500 [Salipiger pacificus]|nr:hypothetical protein [Alloyangia pacifica]